MAVQPPLQQASAFVAQNCGQNSWSRLRLHDPAGPFIQGGVHQVPDVMSGRNGAGAALGRSTHGYIWSGVSTMQEHEEMRVGAGMDSSNTTFL